MGYLKNSTDFSFEKVQNFLESPIKCVFSNPKTDFFKKNRPPLGCPFFGRVRPIFLNFFKSFTIF
jgi:hypothetical protein